jgi:hypothetical protein
MAALNVIQTRSLEKFARLVTGAQVRMTLQELTFAVPYVLMACYNKRLKIDQPLRRFYGAPPAFDKRSKVVFYSNALIKDIVTSPRSAVKSLSPILKMIRVGVFGESSSETELLKVFKESLSQSLKEEVKNFEEA